jgi:hypothetical protein
MAPETVPFLDGLLGNLGYLVSGLFYDFFYRHKQLLFKRVGKKRTVTLLKANNMPFLV